MSSRLFSPLTPQCLFLVLPSLRLTPALLLSSHPSASKGNSRTGSGVTEGLKIDLLHRSLCQTEGSICCTQFTGRRLHNHSGPRTYHNNNNPSFLRSSPEHLVHTHTHKHTHIVTQTIDGTDKVGTVLQFDLVTTVIKCCVYVQYVRNLNPV